MAIHEYKCTVCGKIITIYQSPNAAPVRTCPACLGEMKRLISKSTFHLKGGGWFNDPPKAPEEEKSGIK